MEVPLICRGIQAFHSADMIRAGDLFTKSSARLHQSVTLLISFSALARRSSISFE